jgi:hypothetical protein
MQEDIKQQIFDKLREVEQLLEKATCDGEADVPDVGEMLNTLVEAVDYYVD